MGSSENVDSGKVTGQKSQFSQTCSLLSQFLKKKGSFGDLGIYRTAFEQAGSQQIGATTTTTMNLLPMIEKSSDSSSSSSVETNPNPQNPMNLFPQELDFCRKKTESLKSDQPEKAQMTIFYGGQVIVFDDFPADKANEIMKLANKQNPTNKFTYPMMNNQKPDQSATSFGNNLIHEQLPKCKVPISQGSVADLPIARRNSLTRFLEKRKDRITSIAPYQISNNNKKANSKNDEENKAWLGLAPQVVKTEQYF